MAYVVTYPVILCLDSVSSSVLDYFYKSLASVSMWILLYFLQLPIPPPGAPPLLCIHIVHQIIDPQS